MMRRSFHDSPEMIQFLFSCSKKIEVVTKCSKLPYVICHFLHSHSEGREDESQLER